MVKINAIGDVCPVPVVKVKNAIKEMGGAGEVEILVDNEIAVQNLTKMAEQKGYGISSNKLEENKYLVKLAVSIIPEESLEETTMNKPNYKKKVVVAIGSGQMGIGNEELGAILMKGFLYAITQQEELPAVLLFFNGGAGLTCEGSQSLEDLKKLSQEGVEIYTCGTCLDYYKLKDKLAVGAVTNMYSIVEFMTGADLVIKP